MRGHRYHKRKARAHDRTYIRSRGQDFRNNMNVDSSCKARLLCHGSARRLLFIVFCCAVALPSPSAALLLRKPTDCRGNTSEIVFLALYPPCSAKMIYSSSELARLERCDLLTVAAIDLAVEKMNQNPGISPEGSTFRVIPIKDRFVDDGGDVNMDDKMIMKAQSLANIFHSGEGSSKLWGVIGPSDQREAEFLAPIFHKEDLVTISYGSKTTTTDKVPSFYRTLPSIHGSNYARIHLMAKFSWHRVAILPDLDSKHFELEGEEFVSLINWILESHGWTEYFDSITKFTPISDSQSHSVALRQIQSANVSIMFGLFGPEKARQVLCMANSMGLVSEDHAWILPAYYNPNWWKLPSANGSTFDSPDIYGNCSNEKMEEILESVIFIKNTKVPPLELPLNEFHSQLIAKALDLFPSLTEEDLKPYLLRSRATNAYDAVTLLAQSVGVAFDQHQGGEGGCPGAKEVQIALEKDLDCEYCRMNEPDVGDSEKCHRICSLRGNPLQQHRPRADLLFNHYGQILFSQFIGGHEYPISLLWSVEHQYYYAISELDHAPLAKKLNLSAKDFYVSDGWHPEDFQWKGSSAPDSNFFKHMSIATMEVVLIAVLVTTGLLIAVALLVFNIIWRNNKIVKASSPRLNVIFLIGIILSLPTALFESLAIISTTFDPYRDLLTAMCYFKFWMYYLGEAIFIATLLMKNWRIYRIFHNTRLRNIGSKLSDIKLMMVILLMLLPVVAILIVWSAFDNIRMDFSHAVQDLNLQLITVSACCSNNLVAFQTTFIVYTSITLILLFVLTLLVTNVQRIEFRREGLGSHRAVALAILPLPALYIAWAILLVYFPVMRYHALLWIEFTLTGLLPMLIMIILFAPNVYFVVKEHMYSKRSKTIQSARNKSPLKKKQSYHSFRRETIILKTQLSETEQMIARLLAERHQLEVLDTPTLRDVPKPSATPMNKHDLHLTFNDRCESISTNDASPQSVTTLFTCVGSDYEVASQNSSLSEYSYLLHTSSNANSERLRPSVNNNDDNTHDQRDSDFLSSSSEGEQVTEDCRGSSDSLELRRDMPPAVFIFDMKELTQFESSK